MEKFYLEEYVEQDGKLPKSDEYSFEKFCRLINQEFQREWEEQRENINGMLSLQKNAIIGYEKEVSFFKNKIRSLIKKHSAEKIHWPIWYESLEDGIYHENWGLAGVAEWFSPGKRESSSAKVIGDRIYFLEDGKMVLKPQTIQKTRREQLIRAFLLLTPEERLNKDFHELYMLDGSRVTIFGGSMVKENQDVIIFRRYIIPEYTFEEQAMRGTIPKGAVPLFKSMVGLGYNCAFTGAPRTSKSTFLSTWQSYEDRSLEGVMIETDPEVPLHKIMPEAPVVQVLADNEKLRNITKNLMRSDADYIIMAEAREGTALDTAIRVAGKGMRRMKITFHSRDPLNFPYDVADEIVKNFGGDMQYNAKRAAASFDYIFHFIQLKDKSKKRLKSICEMELDRRDDKINIRPICKYLHETDEWVWQAHIGKEKKDAGIEEDSILFSQFQEQLERLSRESPLGKGASI